MTTPNIQQRLRKRYHRACYALNHAPNHVMLPLGLGLGGALGALLLLGLGGWLGVGIAAGLLAAVLPLMRGVTPVLSAPLLPESPAPSMPTVPPMPAAPTVELLEMVTLPGGVFRMGSAADDNLAYNNERPQHEVTVSAFAIGRYPVTRQFYRDIMERLPSAWASNDVDALWPATHVNWFEAVQFCNALSHRRGLTPCYHIEKNTMRWEHAADGYRLPTEAEWEYAARAGTTTPWFCGDEPDELARYAWFGEDISGHVHPVGVKAANPWGLHDMAGNVWEWCWDWYSTYNREAVTDPSGPDNGVRRVVRGGAVWDEARDRRSAGRRRDEPEDQGDDVGFRVVRRPRRQP